MLVLELILLGIGVFCAGIAAFWNPGPNFPTWPNFGWLAVLCLILALLVGVVGGSSLTKRSDYPWHPLNRSSMTHDKISSGVCAEVTPDTRVTVITQSINDPVPSCDFDAKHPTAAAWNRAVGRYLDGTSR